jgi:hypothetical protein
MSKGSGCEIDRVLRFELQLTQEERLHEKNKKNKKIDTPAAVEGFWLWDTVGCTDLSCSCVRI